jgi:hypothetical protein
MTQVQFNESNHSYHVNGKPVTSVTKILSHSGIVNSEFFRGTEALDRGTLVHDLTARRDSGERIPLNHVPLKFRGFLRAWDKFKDETNFKADLIEHRVVCASPLYAGTLDRLGHFSPNDTTPTILDLKTHNTGRVGQWVKYQLVGYGHALNARKIYQRVGVALHPNGTYAITRFPVTEWMTDLAVFLHAAAETIKGNEYMRRRRNG